MEMTEAIADFVQITTRSANSSVFVDRPDDLQGFFGLKGGMTMEGGGALCVAPRALRL